MAKKDIMTIGGAKGECVNTDQPVGKGQTNLKEDVMLIQALLGTLAKSASPGYVGLISFDQVPKPTGNFEDGLTEKAIWSYQRKNARKLLRVDGIVHPALYKDRNITLTKGNDRLMMISLLHLDLLGFLLWADLYIPEITRTVPELRQWLK